MKVIVIFNMSSKLRSFIVCACTSSVHVNQVFQHVKLSADNAKHIYEQHIADLTVAIVLKLVSNFFGTYCTW